MSRIKGLNDKNTLRQKSPDAPIKVWKGEKKTKNSAGKNLNNLFRIDAAPYLITKLHRLCGGEIRNDNLYIDTIHLIPAYEDEYQAFDSKMTAYNASRPLLFCDRGHIFTEWKLNHMNYLMPVASDKPCPVAGTNHKCPNNCSRTGDFYFHIYELVMAGNTDLCRLQVHGVKDNQEIADFLDGVKGQIGSIKTSPFNSEDTQGYIIYQMTRRQVKSKFPILDSKGDRSEKRGTKDDWIINLCLHPVWRMRYDHYQRAQQLKQLNLDASPHLLEQVYGSGVIDVKSRLVETEGVRLVEGTDPLSLLEPVALDGNRQQRDANQRFASRRFDDDLGIRPVPHVRSGSLPPTWEMDKIKAEEIAKLRIDEGWSESAYEEMLFSYFNIEERSQIQYISQAVYIDLKKYIQSDKIKRDFRVIN